MMNGDRRDYYELLGVERDAAQQTIKRAFRARARALHPDVSTEPDAKERFADLSRAYAVLSRPASRILYDRYGYLGTGNGGFDRAAGADATAAAVPYGGLAKIRVSPLEVLRGATRRVPVATVGLCASCDGSGAARGAGIVECSVCGGDGRLRTSSALGDGRLLQIETCLSCAGRGRVPEIPCRHCRGSGEMRDERTVTVEIPPGAEDGGVVRVAQPPFEGETPGYLYVQIRIVPERDSRFIRWVAAVALLAAVALFALIYLRPEALG